MLSRITKKNFSLFLLLLLSTFLHAQKELKNIDSTLDSIFGYYNLGEKPGLCIAILENNKPTFFKSYGQANLEYQIKNTPNTLFNSTDLAKQFTVFAILLLEEQGKLSIHDNLKKYLPQFNDWPFDITLKHLMEQTSGLRDVVEFKKWQGYQHGEVVTKEDILSIIGQQRHLNFTSGSKFEYNRTGFVLLTEVIAKVSGIPFPAFVQQAIFNPLGMHNSVFVNSSTELIKNRAYSYATTDKQFTKILNNSSFVGGTNLYTSPADFAKWLSNMSSKSIGKPSFYQYMQTQITLSNGEKSNYTPGIYKSYGEGYETIHLEGFDHGYTCYMMYVPEHHFSLAFFSNDDAFDIDDGYDVIYDWFNREYNSAYKPTRNPHPVKLIEKSAAALQKYTSKYLFEDNFSIRNIILKADTLFYVRDENSLTPMIPIEGNHIFKMLVPNNDRVRVTFKSQGDLLEFRSLSTGKDNDYVSVGRKIKSFKQKQGAFSGAFKNAALGHTITLHTVNEVLQLTIDGATILLDQIGGQEFSPRSNSKVKHVRLQRDAKGGVIGVYLSGFQLKDLYYKKV